MTDIFILCVDRDGKAGRRARLNEIEEKLENDCCFFAESAWEAIGMWTPAGLELPK